MAHFAKIENNIVIQVVVVNNDVILEDGTESELKGKQFLNDLLGPATWVQTSYNGNFRKKYAGVGDTYDSVKDKFILPQPYSSWSLDSNDDWQPPVAKPENDPLVRWNEETQSWDSRD